jgi:hypothetical protein
MINKQPRQIENAAEPANNKDNVKRFNPEHYTAT